MPPFLVKICGITNAADASMAAAAGADAIGLNFYAGSKRFITPDDAQRVIAATPSHMCKVGVFVNASEADIRAVLAAVPLDAIQLHGDEPPELLAQLHDQKIIRAFRWSPERVGEIDSYLAECAKLGCLPAALLIDSYSATQFGGTGNTVDWAALGQWKRERSSLPPLVLAGGLTPSNVANAITSAHPAAVDTASGVERSPREKDPNLTRAFIDAAKQAFDKLA